MFPKWDYEVVRSHNWWVTRVAMGRFREKSYEEAVRRKAQLEGLFCGRQARIVPEPQGPDPDHFWVEEDKDLD